MKKVTPQVRSDLIYYVFFSGRERYQNPLYEPSVYILSFILI